MLNNQITEISSDELDKLFDSSTEGSPTANNLTLGKQDENIVVQKIGTENIEEFDESMLDEIGDEIQEEEDDEELTEEQKLAKVTAEKEEADKKAKELEEKQKEENPEIANVLKNTVDYLIEKGLWVDFDGREDLEITQEIYQDLVQKQSQHTAFEIVNELIDGTGAYGKAIINHIKAGGNPDEIIDLFKEEKEIQQIDISTEQGKQLKIERYYKDVLGWKDEKVARFVKKLVEDNEIESEYKDVDNLYEEYYKERLAETEQVANQQKAEATRKQQLFVNSIQTALNEETSLSPQDKKLIASSILEFKHPLSNGQKVNDFYLKFAEMQADPKKYIKLVRYVMDTEGFEKQIQTKEETKAAKQTWNFVKGNQATGKAKTANVDINDKTGVKQQGTNFSFAIKK